MEKNLFTSAQVVVIRAIWGICRETDEVSLSQHRERIEKKLEELTLATPLLTSTKKCLYLFEKAYNDAYEWIDIYKNKIESFKKEEIDFFRDKKYAISNFFTLLGEFDDVTWVDQFVADEDQNVFDRFYFACFYCLEDKIQPLWQEVTKQRHFSGKQSFACSFGLMLAHLWVDYVDSSTMVELITNHCQEHGTPHEAYWISVENGHERALHYFFNKFPEPIRIDIATHFCSDLLWDDQFCTRYPKIMHYLFSYMDTAFKRGYYRNDFEMNDCVSVWNYYLHPQLISLIPSEIERYQDELPEPAYAHFLMKLVLKMTKIKSALYQEAFQAIWRIGSAQNKRCFLEHYRGVLWILVRSKDFSCSRCVLKDASVEERRRFLFESMEELLFENVSFRSDPHAVRHYLMLFLTDLQENDSLLPNPTPFHSDSLNLLKEIQEKLHPTECSQVEPVLEKLILETSNFFLT